MARAQETTTITLCDNCGGKTSRPFTWWEKDGLHKSPRRVEGWREKHNCSACLQMGYEIAEVMG